MAVATPPDFRIKRAGDAHELRIWVDTLAQGFGEGRVEAEWVGEMYRRIGFKQLDT